MQLNSEKALPYPHIAPDDISGSQMLSNHLLSYRHCKILFLDINWTNKDHEHFSQTVRRDTIKDAGGSVEV